ncbi:Tn3 family transposase [Azospirillum argentinense]
MPRRQLLSPQTRAALFDPPSEPTAITRLYTLSPDDLAHVRRRRRPWNRLGFAMQLAYLRHPGRALGIGEEPPTAMLAHIAGQVGADPALFVDYARREETRREHLAELQAAFGLSPFGLADYRAMWRVASEVARGTDRGDAIALAVVEELRARRVLLPVATVVERLGLAVRARARAAAYASLIRGLEDRQAERLLALLKVTEPEGRTGLTQLREWSEAPSAANLVRLAERLATVRAIGIEADRARRIHQVRYAIIAGEAGIMDAQHLSRLGPERRLAVLTAFVIEQEARLSDAAVEMFDRLMGALFRRAERKRTERLTDRAKEQESLVWMHAVSGRALVAARRNGTDPFAAIEAAVGWEAYEKSVDHAVGVAETADEGNSLPEVVERHASARRFAPTFLQTFAFRSYRKSDPLLKAVDAIKALYASEGRPPLAKDAPVSFLQRRWRPLVLPQGKNLNHRAYEMAVFAHLRERLRAGDVWIEGARAYRRFTDFLLPRPTFEDLRSTESLDLPIPVSWPDYATERTKLLDDRLREVATLAEANRLPDVTLEDGRLTISPLSRAVPEAAGALAKRLSALLPRIRITEILAEVDRWTGFTSSFTHVRTGEPAFDRAAVLGTVLADGTNLGLSRMAEASRGLNHARLIWAAEWHVRDETYAAALATVVNAHHAHPMAHHWGPGDTSSSDGQFFRAGGRGEARSDVNGRYGDDPGVLFYTHVSDRFSPFHTKVISATAGEAAHVLDGLLMHGSALSIREHYTDTAGATDHVSGLCHLLGFRFAPRVRDLKERRLYVIDRTADYGLLTPLIGGPVRLHLVEESWDDLLWLATSVRTGTAAPSALLRRLAAYPRQNQLAKALREVGRIERTLATLDWLKDPDLRRRSHAGLNKGEAEHSLKRAVFFHRLGELRDRTFENQSHRASGLNLVVAAIVLWNTVYLGRAVDALRAAGEDIPADLLAHVAPLGWEHIALTGDYVWADDHVDSSAAFRPLRRIPASFQRVAA